MNEKELDEILDSWKADEAPASLRQSVRAEFAAHRVPAMTPVAAPRRRWFGIGWGFRRLAVTAAGLGGVLLVVTQAFPQALGLADEPPFVVESQFVRYNESGPPTVVMLATSYSQPGGKEVMLSRSLPDQPWSTFLVRGIDAVHSFMGIAGRIHRAGPAGANLIARASIDCDDGSCHLVRYVNLLGDARNTCGADPDAEQETILSHRTVTLRRESRGGERVAVWLAPDLQCFALRAVTEERRADGTFHVVSEKTALKVSVNR